MDWPFTTREVLELLGFFSKSSSESFDIPCPYCDDKGKHLNFNMKKNQFRCNRCGAFGNTLQFYQYMLGLNNCKEAYWDIMRRMNLDTQEPIVIKNRSKKVEIENKQTTTVPLLDVISRHETYQAILNHLSLEDHHIENLMNRGLSEMEIINLGYKSFPGSLDEIMNCLYDEGVSFIGVPGFYEYYGKIKFIREKKGILVPVRNFHGYIEGLQLRIDEEEREVEEDGKLSQKYKWISSKMLLKGCGLSAIHYACEYKWNKKKEEFYPVFGEDATFYLTEGPMKADISHFLTDYKFPFVAVAGVNHTTKLKGELEKLRGIGVKRIVLMYDMDYKTNPHVQKALQTTKEIVKAQGLQLVCAEWDEKFKGIDDYLKHRKNK